MFEFAFIFFLLLLNLGQIGKTKKCGCILLHITGLKLTSLFRVQCLLLLQEGPKSGYDIAKRIGEMTGTKPSSGKIYPFLHELRDFGYAEEVSEKEESRGRVKYRLTDRGHELVDELLERMGNILDARLDQVLETCHHCGVKLYDAKVVGFDSSGNEVAYCCVHCRDAGH